MDIKEHESIRETFTWGTYGRDGKDPLKHILVKDITDEHLVNIINHIKERIAQWESVSGVTELKNPTLDIMKNEMEYRLLNNFKKIS